MVSKCLCSPVPDLPESLHARARARESPSEERREGGRSGFGGCGGLPFPSAFEATSEPWHKYFYGAHQRAILELTCDGKCQKWSQICNSLVKHNDQAKVQHYMTVILTDGFYLPSVLFGVILLKKNVQI